MEADVYAVLVLSYLSFASKKVTWLLSTFPEVFPHNGPMSNTNVLLGQAWVERHWWCVDCRVPTDLDRHGRCGSCGSDAVDMMIRPNPMGKELRPAPTVFERLPQYTRTS